MPENWHHLLENESSDIRIFGKNLWITIWLLAVAVLFINNGSIAFWDQDEAAYAGFAHTFLKTGHWLVPDFLWSTPHRKTPLHFWLIAGCFKLFGENEWSTRLPGTLSVLFSAVALVRLGRHTFGREVSRLAAAIMLTTYLLPSFSKISVVDSVLMCCETIAVLGLMAYLNTGRAAHLIWVWLGIASGLMVKGPPVLIVYYGASFLLFLRKPYRRQVFMAGLLGATALLPLLIWGWLVWQADGGAFIRWFIDWYIFRRVSGSVWGQTGYPGYYFVVFCVAFLPWLPFLLQAFFSNIKDFIAARKLSREGYFLFCWLAAGWWFYELLKSKLPAYAIAAYPAVALMTARYIWQLAAEKNTPRVSRVFTILYLVINLGVSFMLIYAPGRFFPAEHLWLFDCVAVLNALSAIAITLFFWRNNYLTAIRASALQGLLFMLCAWGILAPQLEFQRAATKHIAVYLKDHVSTSKEIVFTQDFQLPSMPFYVGQAGFNYRMIRDGEKEFPDAVLVADEDFYRNYIKTHPGTETDKIHGWVSDRGTYSDYYIIMPAKK